MNYVYTARSSHGELSNGSLDADSAGIARQQLRERGLYALSLKAGDEPTVNRPTVRLSRTRRIPRRDVMMATSQLAVMCRAGIDLAEALQNTAKQCTNAGLKSALDEVYQDVSDGKSVSQAMRKQTRVFGDVYVASIAAGEASGRVPQVFVRLTELLRNEIRLQSTLVSVMSYPIVLMSVSTLVLAALICFVLPQFATVFHDLEIPAPATTRMLIAMSDTIREEGWLLGGFLLIAGIALKRLWSHERFQAIRNQLALNVVLIRDVTRSLMAGRSFRLLGTMLESGVPLLDAIQLCRYSVNNRCYHDLFKQLESEVLNGRGIGTALAASPFIPPGAAQMVITGERTGKLGSIMETVGEFYEEVGEQRLREVAKLLEPAVIVVMGVIVAVIVLSVMLPIFDFASAK